jgi:branched-chain amino acid transport system substrate-binding protein
MVLGTRLALAMGALAFSAFSGTALAKASGEPIIIGMSTPLTGGAAYLGQHEKKGAELAIEQINAAGGVLGRPLKLEAEDNRCNPSEGVSSVSRLLDNSSVVGLVGAMCSSVTLALMPQVERAKMPLLVNVSTAKSISEKAGVGGNEWTFQTNPTDQGLAVALASYLEKKNTFKKIAVVGEDTDYGRGGAQMLEAALKAKGIEVVSKDFFVQGTQDFNTLLTRLNSAKPDAIALYALAADQLNFFRQYQGFGMTIPLTGRVELSGLQSKVIRSGVIDGASSVFPYSPAVDTAENKQFVAAFKKANGEDPIYQSFAGYEAIKVVADAIARAGKADRAAVRDALEKTDYASMMGGRIAFDDHNHAHNNAVVLEVRGDEVVVVGLYGT